MKQYGVFDIEANKWINFVCLGFFDGTEYRVFRNIKDFINALNNKRYDKWRIYAHYGGKYDFLFILETLFSFTSDIRIIERNGRLIAITVRLKKALIHFVDSFALMPDSLKKLTIAFDVPHVKGEYDFSKGVRYSKELLKYLESDVLGLYEVLKKFSDYELIDGNVKYTIGSQSLDIFKRHFFKGVVDSMPIQYEKIFRENFYSGGRVEVYKGHGKGITGYDVNSLYPYAMLNEMPCGTMESTETFHPSLIGFYCVDVVSTPEFYIPPYLVKTGKRNFYVNGKGRYYFSSTTLNYLKKEYGIRFKVVFGFIFKRREYIFNDYVQHFYKIKRESVDLTQKLLAKYFLNTLYGKLGQSRKSETLVSYKPGKSFTLSENFSTFGLVAVTSYSKSKFILPFLAAYITELARLKHWQYMQVDEKAVYYGDTDSIYTTSKKLERFVSPEIGMLKNEGTNEGIFLLPKTYALKGKKSVKISFKGFDAKNFSWADFKHSLKTQASLEETRERMLGFKECFTRKENILSQNGHFLKRIEMKKVTKPNSYNQRKVDPSKKFAFDTEAHYIDSIP